MSSKLNVKNIGTHIRFNMAYHSERYGFLIKWIRFEKVILLGSTTATIALVKTSAPEIAVYIGAAVASLLTIGLIVSGADEACHEHRVFYSRWNGLYHQYLEAGGSTATDDAFKEILHAFGEISSEQPPSPITSLLIYSQNKVLREEGSPYRVQQAWWRRLFRNVFDGDADNMDPQYILLERDVPKPRTAGTA